MTVDAFRLKNFMAFRDTGWIELRAITLLFGRNSSGKSAIIRALRLLKQSLYNGQDNEVLRFTVEGQLDLGDFQAALHRRNSFEDYNDKVESQKIVFQFRGKLLDDTLETIHNRVNTWLAQNGFPQLESLEQTSTLEQIDFSLEYGQTYDPVEKNMVTQIVGIHIDCPWPKVSSVLKHTRPLNYLSASRIPPVHYIDNELDLPEAPSQNQTGYMEWLSQWYWESDFDLEKLAMEYDSKMQEDTNWRDVAINAINGFLPSIAAPSIFTNVFYYGQNDFLSHRVNAILDEFNTNIHSFLAKIEYLGPIRPEPERTYMLKRVDIEKWQNKGLSAWLAVLLNGAFAPPLQGDESVIDSMDESPMTKWLKALSLGKQLYIRRFADIPQSDLVAQVFILNDNNKWVNLLDVGYGTSQVLPIIATCLRATPGSLILIEQPELHLHPRAQAALGDLFSESHNESLLTLLSGQATEEPSLHPSLQPQEIHHLGIRLFVETHSEHLLLRLRKRIAETTAAQVLPDEYEARLTHDNLSVFFVNPAENSSQLAKVSADRYGGIDKLPTTIKDFFADDAQEIIELTEAAIDAQSMDENL